MTSELQIHLTDGKPLKVQDISKGKAWTPEAQEILNKPGQHLAMQYNDEEKQERRLAPVAFFSTVVLDGKGRDSAISSLVEAFNEMAAQGWLTGVLSPLCVIEVIHPEDLPEAMKGWGDYKRTREAEAIFIFPYIKKEFREAAASAYPKFWNEEGAIGKPWDDHSE